MAQQLHQNRCPFLQIEEPVHDFINCMFMAEDKCTETGPCLLDDNGDGAAVVLYQAIMKDLVDIVANCSTSNYNSSSTNYSTTTLSSACYSLPPDLHSLGDHGCFYDDGNSSFTIDSLPVVDNNRLHDEFEAYRLQHSWRSLAETPEAASVGSWVEHGSSETEGNGHDRRAYDHQGSATSTTHAGTMTSDGNDAYHGDYHGRQSELNSVVEVRGEESSSSVEDDSAAFGVWVDQVLSSATLVTDDLDVLQPVDSSTADPYHYGAAALTARNSIHEFRKTADLIAGSIDESAPPLVAPGQQQLEPKREDCDFYFDEELGEVIQAEYETLYSETSEDDPRSGGSRSRSISGGKNKRKVSASVSAPGYYDLEELLLSCAQAVARSDSRKAREILAELRRQGASLHGRSCLHRMAFQFCRALEARLDGSGAALYASELASFVNVSANDSIRAWLCMFDGWHYIKISYFFANQSCLAACQGKARLHIVDYGISYGLQWTYLIKALSEREGGPPLLIVTGVQFPDSPGCAMKMAMPVVSTGQRLAEFAAACNVPFEFHGVESMRWQDLDAEALRIDARRRSETALVFNVIKQLQFIPDETVQEEMYGGLQQLVGNGGGGSVGVSPRQKLLCQIQSLNPDLFVVGVSNAGFNVPTFLTRFKDALQHYSSILDMLEVSTEESPERRLMERLFARGIVNVVACEGADRVIRPETYRQWQRRLQRAGFKQLPVSAAVLRRSTGYVRERYHRDCTVMEDHSSPWLLMGWRGRTYMAMSVWRPC